MFRYDTQLEITMTFDFNELKHAELHLYDGLQDEPFAGEHFLINGPVGPLEAVFSPAKNDEAKGIGIICHPHPLYGGSLSNKVVHIISNTFNEMGLHTLRFNFRGVGHSRGRFDKGVGEVEDLRAAYTWMHQRYPELPLWLAGFSFGSFVALKAQRELAPERLLIVAPPVAMFDFDNSDSPGMPWMVVQGARDEVSSPDRVSVWVGQHKDNPPQYVWMGDADHFFHGKLGKLRECVMNQWPQ